ncbi:hypothetical protein O185_25385 [Photorhabdus temperata J3]|uniref:Uncharacterized protein n=1 Tax=Photorhabdus temperata J3 TaxID=1389415 RepID=U7QVB1_PHOTE|nr:hypothetical protein O185_25385 [Photorhabdus temperata J3]
MMVEVWIVAVGFCHGKLMNLSHIIILSLFITDPETEEM